MNVGSDGLLVSILPYATFINSTGQNLKSAIRRTRVPKGSSVSCIFQSQSRCTIFACLPTLPSVFSRAIATFAGFRALYRTWKLPSPPFRYQRGLVSWGTWSFSRLSARIGAAPCMYCDFSLALASTFKWRFWSSPAAPCFLCLL